jgi:outer membrane biosynthesis protein TonB
MELFESAPPAAAPEPPRPTPVPTRRVPEEAPPLRTAARRLETPPPVEPPAREISKRPELVDPPPRAPAELADAPAPASPDSSRLPPILPMASSPDTNRSAGPAVPENRWSDAGEAPSSGSSAAAGSATSSSRAVAAVPPATPSAPSAGSSTGGVTAWARPRGGYQVYPSYPTTARRSGVQGTTHLRVQVLADGRVEIVVEVSAGPRISIEPRPMRFAAGTSSLRGRARTLWPRGSFSPWSSAWTSVASAESTKRFSPSRIRMNE